MTITIQVVGAPGHDNAAFVRIDSGQALHRLLFDCGAGCAASLPVSEVQAVDHVLFSHLHMDHIAGFDTFFRRTFNRPEPPLYVWGPPETARIMSHRFQGFLWNLYVGQPGVWNVYDIFADRIDGFRFLAGEAFAHAHPIESRPRIDNYVFDTADFTVGALQLDHLTPSLAYIVREKPRRNVNPATLTSMGLRPGPWLQQVKNPCADEAPTIEIDGALHDLATLRAALLVETSGDSIAYLTDFLLDDTAQSRLVPALHGCKTLVCESQYRHADLDLANRVHHMTAVQAARLARQANVGQLVLFHVSDRYRHPEWRAMLDEARAIFPATFFPEHWGIS